MNPVIELEHFYLLRSSVLRSEQLGELVKSQQLELGFDYDVARDAKKPRRFRLDFRVKSLPQKDKPDAYSMDFQIHGFFVFPEDTEEARMQYLIRVNGCTILYGILRGIVANVTGAFPEGPLPLPTVMMHDVVTTVERNRNQKTVKSPKKKSATAKPAAKATATKKRARAPKK